ncbi:MAG: hypothetical protein AB7N76_24770 [Planctomycetota bacterium]
MTTTLLPCYAAPAAPAASAALAREVAPEPDRWQRHVLRDDTPACLAEADYARSLVSGLRWLGSALLPGDAPWEPLARLLAALLGAEVQVLCPASRARSRLQPVAVAGGAEHEPSDRAADFACDTGLAVTWGTPGAALACVPVRTVGLRTGGVVRLRRADGRRAAAAPFTRLDVELVHALARHAVELSAAARRAAPLPASVCVHPTRRETVASRRPRPARAKQGPAQGREAAGARRPRASAPLRSEQLFEGADLDLSHLD